MTPHLHDIPRDLQELILLRLTSASEDQLTRTGLFDWLAETVLYDTLNGLAGAPFTGPGFTLARMLSTPPSQPLGANNDKNANGEKKTKSGDLMSGIVATLDGLKVGNSMQDYYIGVLP